MKLYHGYDIVAGPVANDRVYATLTLFEIGSHKAVPIVAAPHRLIAAEVPLELSLAIPNATITLLWEQLSMANREAILSAAFVVQSIVTFLPVRFGSITSQ